MSHNTSVYAQYTIEVNHRDVVSKRNARHQVFQQQYIIQLPMHQQKAMSLFKL